jgi:hypothetical protein
VRFFCGKDWRTLHRAALHRRYADMSFVGARGLHYLLPAFLLAALDDLDRQFTAGVPIAESLRFKLTRGDAQRTIVLLSPAQRAAVAGVLRIDSERWADSPFLGNDLELADALAALDLDKR